MVKGNVNRWSRASRLHMSRTHTGLFSAIALMVLVLAAIATEMIHGYIGLWFDSPLYALHQSFDCGKPLVNRHFGVVCQKRHVARLL